MKQGNNSKIGKKKHPHLRLLSSISDHFLLSYNEPFSSKNFWKRTSFHPFDRSLYLCAETEDFFIVRWHDNNGIISEKKASKDYLRDELGRYDFNEEEFRWCAAQNILDDSRVPLQKIYL